MGNTRTLDGSDGWFSCELHAGPLFAMVEGPASYVGTPSTFVLLAVRSGAAEGDASMLGKLLTVSRYIQFTLHAVGTSICALHAAAPAAS